jgi:ribosomal protein L13E
VAPRNSGQVEKPEKEGPSPMDPITAKVSKTGRKQRRGKGFSREELGKAGSNPKEALRRGIPLDFKRKTCHEENIRTLKEFLGKKKAVSKPKGKSKS